MQNRKTPIPYAIGIFILMAVMACGCRTKAVETSDTLVEVAESQAIPHFDADSAYEYVSRQVAFGPRVPNTPAHRAAGDWLTAMLRSRGANVIEQKMQLRAFDGTMLDARNIFAQFNPEASDRLLLLAHWDCRPWADNDPDPRNHRKPVDGANDGASGVGVLLEIARLLSASPLPHKGVDILFVDAEDWGMEGDDDSWALGTKYFVQNPPVEYYRPSGAILLDMVGADGATFYREYFSEKGAPQLNADVWSAASSAGFSNLFLSEIGTAVTDDHGPLLNAGIPAIDIIDYRKDSGFDPHWHTVSDNMRNISKQTLNAVGGTLVNYIWR